jgi:cardiolipin synthase C
MRNLLIGISVFFLFGCAILTYPPPPVPEVHALPPAENGLPATFSNGFTNKHTDKVTGIKLLVDSREALKWRLAFVDEATSTIDLKCFIWQRDGAGVLLFQRLLEAADRGVRVRFLVDDMV